LQANYKQLRLTLITLLDLWNELRSEHLPESEKPLPASEKEQTIQSPNCNASQPSVQCEFAIQSCTASATPSNVHPERTAPIDDVQSSPSPTSPSKLISGHLPPTQSINSPPLPPAWPPQQSAPPPAMAEPLLTEALNIDPNVSNGAPNLEQPQLSTEGHHPTHLAESVPATTLPAAQQQRPFTFSAKVQPSKKMAPCKTKRGTQQVTLKSDNLNSWFQGIPDLPPQPLRHGPIWETPQGTTMHHTCAPPPGCKVVNGITVQPPPNPTIDQQIVSSFEERDDNLGVWFCTKCYLAPFEKPPDFEMCPSCAENYYFPVPSFLSKDWVCPDCREVISGETCAHRKCHWCGKTEDYMPYINGAF
jgi:hypothetical protein